MLPFPLKLYLTLILNSSQPSTLEIGLVARNPLSKNCYLSAPGVSFSTVDSPSKPHRQLLSDVDLIVEPRCQPSNLTKSSTASPTVEPTNMTEFATQPVWENQVFPETSTRHHRR
jgi:hypothetical protein